MTRILGKIRNYNFNDEERVLLDAEPHVMKRARALFDNTRSIHERGEFTHSPIIFAKNTQNAKDLQWFMSRYRLEPAGEVLEWINNGAARYDQISSDLANLDKDSEFKVSPNALKLSLPLRDYQIQFVNMANKVGRMLLADKMGLGKTPSAIGVLVEPENRPAIIVVPTHLCSQWEREIKRFLPDATTHVIRTFKNYDLPVVDVIITSYNRLKPWQDVLLDKNRIFNTVIFDEIHELRHLDTSKRFCSKMLSKNAKRCFGLSGTPIYNQGSEIFSVMDVISPGCLGKHDDEFRREWCDWGGRVNEPAILHNFLKEQGLFLRRTPEDIGLKFGEHSKHVYTLDADLETLKQVEDVAKALAISVLSGEITESSESARELDWKLRHATGVAKAKSAAEFVKLLCEQGEKVVIGVWHRDVYDILMKELAQFNPVMYSGSETIAQKDKAVQRFTKEDSQVFLISLRSGAGLDGLQYACNHIVMAELDWSPQIHDQLVARLDRDGQTKHVQAFYLTIADGSDPFIMSVLGEKRSQHSGLIEGSEGSIEVKKENNSDRIRDMAKAYLEKIGEVVPESNLSPEAQRVIDALKSISVTFNDENEMQKAIYEVLPGILTGFSVEREVKVSARSRLDFLVTAGNERIAIECKVNQTDRVSVYKQIRKYAQEANVTRLVLYAPWTGVKNFSVDGIPVNVVDFNLNAL